jgi:hypothetical protein
MLALTSTTPRSCSIAIEPLEPSFNLGIGGSVLFSVVSTFAERHRIGHKFAVMAAKAHKQ